MRSCIHCGQPIRAVPSDLAIAIEELRMPRKERLIAEELLTAYPRYLRNSFLVGRIYDDEGEDIADPGLVLMSHISKLRQKLRTIGVGIECPRFTGYRLVLPEAAQ